MDIKQAFEKHYSQRISGELLSIDVPEIGADYKIYYKSALNGEQLGELMSLYNAGDQGRLFYTVFNKLSLDKNGNRLFKDMELKYQMRSGYAPELIFRISGEIVEKLFANIGDVGEAKKH